MSYNHHQHYGQQPASAPVYDEYSEYADIDEPAVAESRPGVSPASHPLFTREEISNTRALDPYPPTQSPQSWPPYGSSFQQQSVSYAPYPSPSPFPPPRLSPPPTAHHQFHFKAPGQSTSPGSANHRLTLAGSLDPATGIFYRTPEHPRLRTAQACEKCRTRKAKCSGEHPSCKRCITRGLICEYAKEGRVRGPNKPKPKASTGATSTASPSASASSTSTTASLAEQNDTTPTMTKTSEEASKAARHRAPSSQSSGGSSDQTTGEPIAQRLFLPSTSGIRIPQAMRGEYLQQQALSDSPPSSSTPISLSRGRRSVVSSGPPMTSSSSSSRQNSLGGHPPAGPSMTAAVSSSRQNSLGEYSSSRPYPADVHLDTASSLFRLSEAGAGEEGLSHSSSVTHSGSVSMISTRMGDLRHEESNFYHFQPQPPIQQQEQHRGSHEHAYLAETGIPEQHHAHRSPPPPVEQPYQKFQSQRNVFPMSSQYGSRRESHSLSQVSLRTGTPQGHSAFPTHRNIQTPGEHFRGPQQQHSLVPIISMGAGLPDEAHSGRRPEHGDEFSYPPQNIRPYYHLSQQHHQNHGVLPELAIDTAVRGGHLHQTHLQHEYRSPAQQQHIPQHLVIQSQIAEHLYQEHRQPQYLERAPYGQPQEHVVMSQPSPRTASTTSNSPLTASSSGGIPVYQHHHGVIASGPLHMDPGDSMPPSSSSSSSVSSAALLYPHGGRQMAIEASHGCGMVMDQAQASGHMPVDAADAAVHHHRGSLSVSASLASLASNVSRHGPSPSETPYAGGGDERHEDAGQTLYSTSMDMTMH
ncbi:hypothetical protein BDN70DRAFT_997584 [Pholiota conissans]|uniref:Zn(2)-C6 fungal-type domain-containing protein n=1 Tax=Pholiota conissans TaxID=109636 RepID=A0A9P6CUU6_9AGAR|nr:hypothetical protein BDN70DRAFT_997584 [Pholiota conissans]